MAKFQAYDELDSKPEKKPEKRKGRRGSWLGRLGVLVGLAAVLVAQRERINEFANQKGLPCTGFLWQVDKYVVQPYQVALVGAGLAVFALLLRSLTGRTRAGWPMLALLLSVGAAANYRYEQSPREPGSPERWVQDRVVDPVVAWVDKKLHPAPAPVVDPVAPPAAPVEVIEPTTKPSVLPAPSVPATPTPSVKVPEPEKKSNNIFGL